jgi:hypothetical protein
VTRSDTTPIRDPRNAVGLLAEVLGHVLATPLWEIIATDGEHAKIVPATHELGNEFTKSPRNIFNGYRRRGSSDFYQRAKTLQEKIPADLWLFRDNRRREYIETIRSLAQRIVYVIIDAMEDIKRWEKFISPWVEPARYGQAAKTNDPEWHKAWHDYVSGAQRLGVDLPTIALAECNWRFRDLTDRSHRGRNVKAAFEAAWLAGQYKFAEQLVTDALR